MRRRMMSDKFSVPERCVPLYSRRGFLKSGGAAVLAGATGVPVALAQPSEAKAQEPISPGKETIPLFNGRDLHGLYSWLQDSRYSDARGVFTVKGGLLVISGEV